MYKRQLYTCLVSWLQAKATAAAAAILLAFAMLFGGLYLYNRLDEPPSYPDSYRQENGQMIQQPGGVNPNYLQGKQRVVYEILYDLLPDGQGMQILSGEVASPQALGRNAGASLLLMGLTTALGLGEFRRKDLR